MELYSGPPGEDPGSITEGNMFWIPNKANAFAKALKKNQSGMMMAFRLSRMLSI